MITKKHLSARSPPFDLEWPSVASVHLVLLLLGQENNKKKEKLLSYPFKPPQPPLKKEGGECRLKKEKNFSRPTQPSNNKKEKKRGLKKAFFCRPSAGPLTDGGEQDKFFGTGNRRNKKRINWIFTFFLIETLPPAGSRYFLTPPSCQNGRTEGNGNGKIGRKSTARPCPHKMAENGKKKKGGGDLAAFFFFSQSREKVIVLRSTGLL